MIDLNEFYEQYRTSSSKTEFEMVITAAREIFKAVQENYYDFGHLESLDFEEICNWCGWPYFDDDGIFEQAIKRAANMVCEVLGYKLRH